MHTKEYGNYLIPKLEPDSFIFFKDEDIVDGKGKLGVDKNRILEIPHFISESTAESLVSYFKEEDRWGETAFNGSRGAPLQLGSVQPTAFGLPNSIFEYHRPPTINLAIVARTIAK